MEDRYSSEKLINLAKQAENLRIQKELLGELSVAENIETKDFILEFVRRLDEQCSR